MYQEKSSVKVINLPENNQNFKKLKLFKLKLNNLHNFFDYYKKNLK
jgi:hypothetical protein